MADDKRYERIEPAGGVPIKAWTRGVPLHGAGRAMSRGEAKRRFTVADHVAATAAPTSPSTR
jgi:hypothetical protein